MALRVQIHAPRTEHIAFPFDFVSSVRFRVFLFLSTLSLCCTVHDPFRFVCAMPPNLRFLPHRQLPPRHDLDRKTGKTRTVLIMAENVSSQDQTAEGGREFSSCDELEGTRVEREEKEKRKTTGGQWKTRGEEERRRMRKQEEEDKKKSESDDKVTKRRSNMRRRTKEAVTVSFNKRETEQQDGGG